MSAVCHQMQHATSQSPKSIRLLFSDSERRRTSGRIGHQDKPNAAGAETKAGAGAERTDQSWKDAEAAGIPEAACRAEQGTENAEK